LFQGFDLFSCTAQPSRPPREIASPPGSVDCCATHLGRLFPPLFPSPDRPCSVPDPPLLIIFVFSTIISPRSFFFYHRLSTFAIISSRSLFLTTAYQPLPLSLPDLFSLPPPVISPVHYVFPLSLLTNPLSFCVDDHCLITTRSFPGVVHVRLVDRSTPRLLVGAVLEGSRPRPADVPAPSGRSQAERSNRSRRYARPRSDPRP
jgi:hypothetical protein